MKYGNGETSAHIVSGDSSLTQKTEKVVWPHIKIKHRKEPTISLTALIINLKNNNLKFYLKNSANGKQRTSKLELNLFSSCLVSYRVIIVLVPFKIMLIRPLRVCEFCVRFGHKFCLRYRNGFIEIYAQFDLL